MQNVNHHDVHTCLTEVVTRVGVTNALELLRERGEHFDLKGQEKTSLTELLRIDGLFPLKEIKDRIPIPQHRLKKMIYSGGAYAHCFYNPFKGENSRGVLYVDLVKLNGLIQGRLKEKEQL